MPTNSSKSNIYYKILKIGMENLEDGLTLDEVIQKVGHENLSKFITICFLQNFTSSNSDIKSSLGNILDWNEISEEKIVYAKSHKHILTPESVSIFLRLEDSKTNLKGAKISRCISLIAIFISLGILFSSITGGFRNWNFGNEEDKTKNNESVFIKTDSTFKKPIEPEKDSSTINTKKEN